MMTGKLPFIAKNRAVLQKKITTEKMKIPSFLTSEAGQLIKSLMNKDQGKRLGAGENGTAEVKASKWFKGVNWAKTLRREASTLNPKP